MTATQDFTSLLQSANIDGVDGIYPTKIPDSIQESVTTTDILVTEVSDDYTSYGSNQSTERQQTIAVNIFYGNKSNANADTIENSMVSFCESRNWVVVYSPGHTIDPDTKQLSKVFQFRHMKGR
ncbi:DUF806 family protein [Lactobacillus rhamnosus]|uniref:DUF806 family protein n=1 Tax=Lacticaseibacillus rhamnosus TaxID=47715 RepID=A0A7Y7QHR0_LACRH|nr:DUF806 family protein [Lacticaseibacillus rhamnosus]NVO88950.1 DUF806 family protein [Lacticaseibacillus rhamnosus]